MTHSNANREESKNNNTNTAQNQTQIARENSSKNNRDISGAKTRQQKTNQVQMEIRQEQQKVEEE
jgi:hypothetical protein